MSGFAENQGSSRRYYTCFVPGCTNTTVSTPDKIFIGLPRSDKLRKLWSNAARRDGPLISASGSACCEDHFTLEKDAENYMYQKLMGGKIRLKAKIVPHKFDCQRRSVQNSVSCLNRTALRRKRMLAEVLYNHPGPGASEYNNERDSCTEGGLEETDHAANSSATSQPDERPGGSSATTFLGLEENMQPVSVEMPPAAAEGMPVPTVKTCDRAVQTCSVNTEVGEAEQHAACNQSTQTSTSELFGEVAARPLLFNEKPVLPSVQRLRASSFIDADKSSDYVPSDSEAESCGSADPTDETFFKVMARKVIRNNIEKHPARYIGVPEELFGIISLLENRISFADRGQCLTKRDVIFMILYRLRQDTPSHLLADQFGVSAATVSRLLARFVPVIAVYVGALVVWPDQQTIRDRLPHVFLANFSSCESIIDCFEIQIEKPARSVSQSLSWSEYKKCNSVKYVISATPDGMINFISKGKPGRVSDMELVRSSGYLECLRRGVTVLADRGFKELATELARRGCSLVRPPSVQNGKQLDADEVVRMRTIAGVRIHIERVIARVRVFKMLSMHACTPLTMMDMLDDMVRIACGLVNLQDRITKS
ncbi:uncharacterized protein LOC122363762 isoform X1 [Amphibalanus amphitrite]|uniref:uncharacterized protein LOC122363762 isoform X1 n=1 Tax=Amphibalanus amphitrite TaxID=1232801 RepID=UPI001C908373|nr:uncharacterized protein LOC122363762 isoform X1 [Amphibalanus amphitrite]